ncbi:MAG: ABC transporter substrate-binding protein [Rhodospirillaceae bacterium]|nr:ABC transporter substrate-binding protein [Rhodospirillaceae bacterium]
MKLKAALLAGAVLLAAGTAAQAETLRFAFQGQVSSLDPHSLNETFTLGYQGNIYEGLISRGPNLEIEPALATSWELMEPTRWRFHLREGVTFHNGNPFTADDVVFSYERAISEGSDVRTKVGGITEVVAVDDYTVDFITESPNPIIMAEWETWYIMDREWCEEHGATGVTNVADPDAENYANLHANGTGPFMVTVREPGVRTVAVPFADWWGEPQHNLTEVVFTPIAEDATRVAALLAGDVDMAYPIPLQDIERVEDNDGTRALTGPELRTIFLGMDQARDELLYSSVEGTNPFQDRRVRLAFYQAIDMNAIQQVVMRGQSTPSAAMVAPGINGFPEELERYPYDPEAARALLAEAGYPEGFSVRLNCPNDRYVNDEDICIAVTNMLGQVGIDVELMAETKSIYFGRILAQGGYDTSFYLLGWTPGSFDSYNVLYNLVHTRNEDGAGTFNNGGYSNPEVDALTAQILSETDQDARAAMIAEAWQMLHDDVGYIPLHQQALAWGVSDNVELIQRADNEFVWNWVTINE